MKRPCVPIIDYSRARCSVPDGTAPRGNRANRLAVSLTGLTKVLRFTNRNANEPNPFRWKCSRLNRRCLHDDWSYGSLPATSGPER